MSCLVSWSSGGVVSCQETQSLLRQRAFRRLTAPRNSIGHTYSALSLESWDLWGHVGQTWETSRSVVTSMRLQGAGASQRMIIAIFICVRDSTCSRSVGFDLRVDLHLMESPEWLGPRGCLNYGDLHRARGHGSTLPALPQNETRKR